MERHPVFDPSESMAMPPLVSVIIPTYNPNPVYFQRAIQSVLTQTYPSIEIIVIDDHSQDISFLNQDFPINVKVLTNKKNKGVSASRNSAIKASIGHYIALLDQDDFWTPEKLQKQIACMEKFDAMLSYCDMSCVDPSGKKQFLYSDKFGKYGGNQINLNIGNLNFMGCSTMVFTKKRFDEIGGFDETFNYSEDWDLAIRLVAYQNACYIDKPLVTYQLKSKSFQRFNMRYHGEIIRIVCKHNLSYFSKKPESYYPFGVIPKSLLLYGFYAAWCELKHILG